MQATIFVMIVLQGLERLGAMQEHVIPVHPLVLQPVLVLRQYQAAAAFIESRGWHILIDAFLDITSRC